MNGKQQNSRLFILNMNLENDNFALIFFLVLFLFADLNEIHELQKTVDIRGNLA